MRATRASRPPGGSPSSRSTGHLPLPPRARWSGDGGRARGRHLPDVRTFANEAVTPFALLPDGRRVIDQEWARVHLARLLYEPSGPVDAVIVVDEDFVEPEDEVVRHPFEQIAPFIPCDQADCNLRHRFPYGRSGTVA